MLQEEKDVSEFYVPQVVNMSFLVGFNCKNLKKIEEKTNTFLRPKGSHKVSSHVLCVTSNMGRVMCHALLLWSEICSKIRVFVFRADLYGIDLILCNAEDWNLN